MYHKTDRNSIFLWMQNLQDEICKGLEELDGKGRFEEDVWKRPEGGGGRSRVIHGQHIEKGGVMWSGIEGMMPDKIAAGLGIDPVHFHATGVSIAVSYTHLRAHETPEHLVCRLLLEKKK